MAVVGQRKNRAFKSTARADERRITGLQKRLDKINAKKNKLNSKGVTGNNKVLNSEVSKLKSKIRDLRGVAKMDLKKNPLKIDNKGLTPNVQVKKKVEVKKKTPVKTETRAEMLKRKIGSTYDPTKANRAGQKMGQRKAGGMIKKMKGGGMAMKYGHGGAVAKGKKCPRDGIAMKGKTRA